MIGKYGEYMKIIFCCILHPSNGLDVTLTRVDLAHPVSEARSEACHEADLVTELQSDPVLPPSRGDRPQTPPHLLTGHNVREDDSLLRHWGRVDTHTDVWERLETNTT